MPFEPLHIEDLRIGHYVKLECSWWKHPFATNTFKVTTKNEIYRIKKISKLKLFYDPDLSDPVSDLLDEDRPTETDPPVFDLAEPTTRAAKSIPLDADPQYVQEEENTQKPKFLYEDRITRCEVLKERRKQLNRTEREYGEATKQAKVALKNISAGDVSGLRMAEHMLSDLTKTLKANRSVMAILEVMNSSETEDPLFVHAMNVSVLSLLVGKVMNLDYQELMALGVGALAHDIGFLNLPRDVRLTTAGFAREGAQAKFHIQQGLAAIDRIPEFPQASAKIIAQHHERLNGKGYPHGLTRDDISPLAKIVMIVDEYDERCNHPEKEQDVTPYEALSIMYQNATVRKNGEFDDDILIMLIQTLGVYPPGTLVELNDGSVGVVMSINPQCRIRPQVLIYVPGLPQDEATIVDLSQDEELTIEKSLRPNQISKAAKSYLCPSRITGFFPSTSEMSLFSQTRQTVS